MYRRDLDIVAVSPARTRLRDDVRRHAAHQAHGSYTLTVGAANGAAKATYAVVMGADCDHYCIWVKEW